MQTRNASGFILVRKNGGEPEYLLLRSTRHNGWGFPKGHAEDNEDDLATARRETLEETGIADVKHIEGFKFRCEYDVRGSKRGSYHKVVTYLLGTTAQQAPILSDEHIEAGWYTLAEATARVKFEMMRDALKQADEFFRTRP